MYFPQFETYRHNTGTTKPITPEERERILNPFLRDSVVSKMIGLKMLTDGKDDNNFLGYLLAAGSL